MRKIYLDTYWIDKYEVTNEQYDKCVAAGVCSAKMPFKGFQGAKQPVMPATWVMADGYCRWAGRRLPTEAEWEKAARGVKGWTWPWGEASANCKRAHTRGCKPDQTLPVGSLPANDYGLFDVAGNSYEWVADWHSECYSGCKGECGEECFGRNPKGPCGGEGKCQGRSKRVLKGGSWYWPSEQARPSWRRGSVPETGGHRLGFRCAATPPGFALVHEADSYVSPGPISGELVELLGALPEDDLPPSRLQSAHYVTGNELRNDLFAPYIERIGGALVGVGSDQNFTLAALARSELVFIFDYDIYVVFVDKIHVIFLKNAPSRDDFVALWSDVEKGKAALAGQVSGDELEAYVKFQKAVSGFLVRNRKAGEAGTRVHWLGSEKTYGYVRGLAVAGRVKVSKGDLLGGRTVTGIGEVLRAAGIPARILYLSNCEEYWSYYTEGLESSYAALPIDERTVVLRTFHDTALPKAGPDRYYHYNVQSGTHFVETIAKEGRTRYRAMMKGVATLGKGGEFSLLGF